MDKNITLTVSKHNYEQREHSTVAGHAYNVRSQAEGSNQVDTLSNQRSIQFSQFNAVDSALHDILVRATNAYYTTAVTIEGATLPESIQTFLTDKYEVESQITSITFA